MKLVKIPLWTTNPHFPLPPNYEALVADPNISDEALRQIRVNACYQYLRADLDYPDIGEAKARCLNFFDRYYLRPCPEDDFDPLFYDSPPLETPPFHWDFVRVTGNPLNVMNLMVAPRGSAKTTLNKKLSCLEMVTRAGWSITYGTSSHDNAEKVSDDVRNAIYNNSRIHDDFAPEPQFDGRIRPMRGDRKTGVELFFLNNGSSFRSVSASSKLRGIRALKFRLDDPEHDEANSTSMEAIRTFMERLVMKIILPMVQRAEASVEWAATFVSKMHYAWTAAQTEPYKDAQGILRERAIDERFEYWNRLVIKACREENGKLISCWPEMWPVDEEDRIRHKRPPTTRTLRQIELSIGKAAFEAEYMANPGATGKGETFFGDLTEKKHGYTYSAIDDLLAISPYKSNAIIHYYRGDEEIVMPLSVFLSRSRLCITCDTSFTDTSVSDYKACSVFALTPDNDLFVLDTWAARKREDQLVKQAFFFADKWHCPSIHPEVSAKSGHMLFTAMNNIVNQRACDMSGTTWLPRIVKYNPGLAEKTTRIAALLPRFEHGKIKLPLILRYRSPWLQLFDQIQGFNPVARNGGLQNDDILDTVQMTQHVYRGLPSKPVPSIIERTVRTHDEALALIKKGEKTSPEGYNLGHMLDLTKLTPEDLAQIQAARFNNDKEIESYA